MGIVTSGPPAEIVVGLAELANATAFVETGTFRGATAQWASQHFPAVYTIERDQALYERHEATLRKLAGVTPFLGDSRVILPQVVAQLDARNAVYWLDGHWSGQGTAGEGDECPLLEELSCVAKRTRDIILIDDARLFLCSPPRPHRSEQWPGIADVVAALGTPGARPYIQIVDDVIFAVPDMEPIKGFLQSYAQDRADSFWRNFAGLQGAPA